MVLHYWVQYKGSQKTPCLGLPELALSELGLSTLMCDGCLILETLRE
jgi:hypothetical protein